MLFCLFSLGISKVVGIKFNCAHLGNAWACERFLHVGTVTVNLQAAKLNWNQTLACHIGEVLPFSLRKKIHLRKYETTAWHQPDISSIIIRSHLVRFSAGYPGDGGGGLIAELLR
jgi:hypothetical protein